MDYFEKVKKLLSVQELSQRRLKQIEKEQKFDLCLKDSYMQCPTLVFQYLLKTRELNRKYAQETYSATVLEYPEKAEKNLSIIDKMYQKYSTECPKKICQQLPELLKELEKL